jgi:hypothetical protein
MKKKILILIVIGSLISYYTLQGYFLQQNIHIISNSLLGLLTIISAVLVYFIFKDKDI